MITNSVPRKGMIKDIVPSNLDGTSYPFMLNGSVESNSQEGNLLSIQNEGSNILAINFPLNYVVIGKRKIHEQNRTIYALLNTITGDSEFGEVIECPYDDNKDDKLMGSCIDCVTQKETTPLEQTTQEPYCVYRTIISNKCLNFNINYPVKIRYKITDCSLNIYFTDKLNQRRFLYFDYNASNQLVINQYFKKIIGYTNDACHEPIYSDELDCNKLNYHPLISKPCIDFAEVVYGGSLQAGTYQFIIQYSDVKGNAFSDAFPATNPIPIFSKEITIDTDYRTDKAISLVISNLNEPKVYDYYNLIVAETINNFTSFKLVGTFPTVQKFITYSGNEQGLLNLTAEDVFSKSAFYKTAGGIADSNNILFFSDLEEFSKPNLQRVANNVSLYWKTIAVPETIYKDPKYSFLFRGYQRDEVYPFAIIFVKGTGEELGPFHIPGPSKARFLNTYGINVDATVSNNDVLEDTTCSGLTRNKLWQVYNTATVIGTPHESIPNCESDGTWEYGEFSYWESTRTYPNDPEVWGDLCGKPIRHHKFPDSRVTHIHDGLNGAKSYFDLNIIYPIGLRVDHNSVKAALTQAVIDGIITQEERDEITEYRIVRGNRVGNKSIVAKGLLYDMWKYDKHGNTYYYPNYPYNDLRPDNLISNNPNTYTFGNNSSPKPNTFAPSKRYTFHSPDTHFNNPFIGTEIKLETEEYGKSEGYFNEAEEQAKYKFLSTAATLVSFAAGIAAAFSAEKEKECKTIVSRSTQAIDLVAGTGTTAPAIPGVQYAPISVLDPGGVMKYEDFTGLPVLPVSALDPLSLQVAEVQRNTCHGKTFQLLNLASGNPAGAFFQQLPYLAVMSLKEIDIMNDLFKSIISLKNFAIQYNSIGKYNNFRLVNNSTGNKIRKIERSAYLEPIIQLVNEAVNTTANQYTNVYVNNWNRERSVYLKLDNAKIGFPSTITQDTSRITLDSEGLKQDDLNKRVYKDISSYYASLKNFVPDQYGAITDIAYLETNSCTFDLSKTYTTSQDGLYGGDTFITRFALKRKMPFFLQTRFRFNNEADVRYSDLGNVGYPNYYFNTPEPLLDRLSGNTFDITKLLASFADLIGVANTRLDAKKQKLFNQSGFIHVYNYGIPYFLSESDVNCDFRHGENAKEKDFYPHQQDLNFWFQEKNVPITEDNYFFYNKTYSKQNKESVIGTQPFIKVEDCKTVYPYRIINSQESYNDNSYDNWLVFKANDLYDAPASLGRIIGLDGIENNRILARFENTSQIFNSYDTLKLDAKEVAISNGGLFTSRPKQFSATNLGYAGSQHSDILNTEFGHIWADAKRGQIFNMGANADSLDELCASGMKNWFKENLPFQIIKDFPAIDLKDIDNNFKGIGLHFSFDKRFNRFFITKLDYKRIHAGVIYDPVQKEFIHDNQVVRVTNTKYFCNKSWTASYNFMTKTWVSFHSFIPNFYVDDVEYTQSGINDLEHNLTHSSLWSHNLTNKSYQVYYGKIYPFIIELLSEPMLLNGVLNSVQYDCDVIRYHNLYDTVYLRNITFNKALIYNDRQCSGPLELIVKNEEDLFASIQYPKVENNKIKILVTNRDNKWRFNQFFDTVKSQTNNVPFIKNECSNVNKVLNTSSLNYYKSDVYKQPIAGRQTRIRLENDKYSNYKFIFNFGQENQTKRDS